MNSDKYYLALKIGDEVHKEFKNITK